MDKAVLEIGAGTGLVSIVAALLGERFLTSSRVLQVEKPTVGVGVEVVRHSVVLSLFLLNTFTLANR